MKARSRSQSGSPIDLLRLRAWKLDALTEAPQVSLSNVETRLNMSQFNGLFKDQSSPERHRDVPLRMNGSPNPRSAHFTAPDPPSPEPPIWSSAIGHASTGKSGRVIERLQGDIDRLYREKELLKVRYEESEKAREALNTRNQYLQDRNSNYEQSHDTSARQLVRKERQMEELREESAREKAKTAVAEESARAAASNEEEWKAQASLAKAMAAQKDAEYDAIVACRSMENDRYQTSLDKMKINFEQLLEDRKEDFGSVQKLEIIAEQQHQTIGQLEEYTRKITANFKAYRSEIDKAISEMREHVDSNDSAVTAKLDEMKEVAGKIRWMMNIDRRVDHPSL